MGEGGTQIVQNCHKLLQIPIIPLEYRIPNRLDFVSNLNQQLERDQPIRRVHTPIIHVVIANACAGLHIIQRLFQSNYNVSAAVSKAIHFFSIQRNRNFSLLE